jgi:hypothetical protein
MSIQLTCPHCRSTLSFGQAIPAGTPISCLICSQTFRAAAPAPTAPPIYPTPAKLQPGILGTQVAPPRRPAPTTEPAGTNPGLAGLTAILGLLLMLGGVVGYVVWKSAFAKGPVEDEPVVASVAPVARPSTLPKPAEETAPAPAPPAESKKIDEPVPDVPVAKPAPGGPLLQRKPRSRAPELDPDTAAEGSIAKKDTPALPKVWGVDQAKVDAAIAKGVRWLRTNSWDVVPFEVGTNALAALTLLECGAAPDDPLIQRAAADTRAATAELTNHGTYLLGLAILFLDRLGDPSDRRFIQAQALRLLASQNADGGWSYEVPLRRPEELARLYLYLHSRLPAHLQRPLAKKSAPVAAVKLPPGNSFEQFGKLIDVAGIEKPGPTPVPLIAPESLPSAVLELPVVRRSVTPKLPLTPSASDNSNTQFALLALWTARRHGVPVDAALLAADERFRGLQQAHGKWGYDLNQPPHNYGSMTAVGLIGLAVGLGVKAEWQPAVAKRAKADPDDPVIRKGLEQLAAYIGTPVKGPDEPGPPGKDLYFMWALERTAMLYGLDTISGKDWYGWGAQLLLAKQQEDGSWFNGGYPFSAKPLDTCFALLFLKRSNLVRDLTEKLRLHMPIRDPQAP